MANYCVTNWKVLFSKDYQTFNVNYGDSITIRCEGNQGSYTPSFFDESEDEVPGKLNYGPRDKAHKIKLWKKNRRLRRYNQVVAFGEFPIGGSVIIHTEKLGVGKFMYYNNNGEKIRFYVR